jgi:hypothetical protein
MNTDSEYQRLLARIAQLEQTNERLVQKNERLEQTNEQLEQAQQSTTLRQYLEHCHRSLFQSFTVRPAVSGTSVTKVDGKFYPLSLRPWTGHTELEDEFGFIKEVLKDERLFTSVIGIKEMQRRACETPVASEDDIKPFEHIAVEGPVMDIIREFCARADSNPAIANLNVSRISFANHSLSVNLPADELTQGDFHQGIEKQRRDPSPTKRVAVEPKEINPDRRCLREDFAGNRAIAFVVEYKAAHKLQANQVRRGLDEHLFTNVIKRRRSTKSSTNSAQVLEERSDQILAMVLTQTFDYMIRLGLKYSYLTAGKSFLFLVVEEDDPATLYYHLVDPGEEAEDDEGVLTEFKTAVAQVACFSLLALRSKARSPRWTAKAQEVLAEWPIPYVEMEHETTDEEDLSRTLSNSSDLSFRGEAVQVSKKKVVLRSTSSCKDSDATRGRRDDTDDAGDSNETHSSGSGLHRVDIQTKRAAPSSSGSSSSSHTDTREQSRPYCSLGCLISLKKGQELDANCPNVASHRLTTGMTKHPIRFEDLAILLQQQLAHSLDRHCEPLEMKGKYGAVGTLFKLTLAQYGYTFVGKGTIQDFIPFLTHAAKVFNRLERVQGEAAPVHLGNVTLTQPYHLTAQNAIRFAGTKIVHMLLMSWGGEVATNMGECINLPVEVARSLKILRDEGVVHDDPREPNWLWNEERNRILVIDFDTAYLLPRPKPQPRPHRRILGTKKRSMSCQDPVRSCKRRVLGTV